MKTKYKNIYLLFFFFLFTNIYGQNILIEYDNESNGKFYKNELILNDTISLWKYKQDDKTAIENNQLERFIYKNYNQNTIYNDDGIFNQKFFVKDTLNNMKWELSHETKNILEQKCLSASTIFRGRKYLAFYSISIPFSNGPWKFGGLPGLILEIKSTDNIYKYSASKIILNTNRNINVSNFLKKDYIIRDEFVKKFIEVFDNYIKKIKASGVVEDGDEVNIKIVGPEIIYPKVQCGDGVRF